MNPVKSLDTAPVIFVVLTVVAVMILTVKSFGSDTAVAKPVKLDALDTFMIIF